ncbi:MAG: DUF1893 domain-containing protein [Candidatus Paceibacterota bacterium]
MKKQFEEFSKGKFNLFIFSGDKLIFKSKKEGISGLIFFIKKYGRRFKNLVIFDTKVGNAVALLCAYLKVKKIYGLVGSRSAVKTLKKFKIKYFFKKTITRILNKKGTDICPMEKLSSDKTPEEFCSRF